MTKFSFRLERLLDHRRNEEQAAKDHYLQSRAKRIDLEHDIEGVRGIREKSLGRIASNLRERMDLELYLQRLEDESRALHSALGVLVDEEHRARELWLRAKQDADALDKLRENEYAEWVKEANKKEQEALDEWATMRRAA